MLEQIFDHNYIYSYILCNYLRYLHFFPNVSIYSIEDLQFSNYLLMEYEKKLKDITNTAESFCPLQKEELASQRNPLLTQITDLCSNLTQKKAQLRELKLETQNLKGKRDQQDNILIDLKTNLEHKIQAE